MKKTVAIRNKQTKPVELIFFENLCRDNMVLRMSLKYIHESTSLTEAGYHVRLVNNLFRSFPQIYGGNFEVVFKIEKETESGPPIYKVVLLCEGKCITELFELDIREIHETEVQRRLKIPKPLNYPEVNEFM